MATYQLLRDIRAMISDQPVTTFNETTSDGINASWRLTNNTIQIASESVFVSGIIQQETTIEASALTQEILEEESVLLDMGANSSYFSVGDFITLDETPDPYKFRIQSISDGVMTLNRAATQSYPANAQVIDIARNYTIDYDSGIIYFNVAWTVGTKIAARFSYTRHSDRILNNLLDIAAADVARDINETIDLSNSDHASLVLLKTKVMVAKRELLAGVGSAIKIKQGSTSLDLTGSTYALKNEGEAAINEYKEALERYLNNLFDDAAGEAIVGRDGYMEG